ncbi:MAG: hypothetical protein II998_00385 [Clostridia bacterium]|nr:hypothetical protein [Clostridia bacterium]
MNNFNQPPMGYSRPPMPGNIPTMNPPGQKNTIMMIASVAMILSAVLIAISRLIGTDIFHPNPPSSFYIYGFMRILSSAFAAACGFTCLKNPKMKMLLLTAGIAGLLCNIYDIYDAHEYYFSSAFTTFEIIFYTLTSIVMIIAGLPSFNKSAFLAAIPAILLILELYDLCDSFPFIFDLLDYGDEVYAIYMLSIYTSYPILCIGIILMFIGLHEKSAPNPMIARAYGIPGAAPAPAPYNRQPAPNPYGAQSAPSPYGTQPAPSPYGTQPAPNPYGTQPTPNPYGTQPAPNPYGTQPAPNPYGTQPAPNPYGTQPAPNLYGAQPPQAPAPDNDNNPNF